MRSKHGDPRDDFADLRGEEMGRDAIPEHPEPVCAHLRQDVSLLGHGLGHNHVEGADPVAGDQQYRLVVGGIHLTDLALADQR